MPRCETPQKWRSGVSTTLRRGSSGPEVITLQNRLNALGTLPPLKPDGQFGPRTEAAVIQFQRARGLVPDGVVGPRTWAALNAGAHKPGAPAPAHAGSVDDFGFPLAHRPSPDWRGGARYFGAPRGAGRLHAGCDLLARPGTPIYAIADGELIQGPYVFTSPPRQRVLTHAVEARHGSIIVRYGEIKPGSYVGGKHLKRGQVIAVVGGYEMLHFEVYTNGADASSLSGGRPYSRRGDVTDPAPYLEKWVKNLPR